ncbi:BCCT family transporter [Nocardiopsis chromatogenes]|uniref:BCCT family transporter n=1 Tax=Nocardiopsis chromatogenes TaxID=280239 RepID=UPI00034ACD5E|nr:BCCT family transporter [Nocardiopsis chromatogenes]
MFFISGAVVLAFLIVGVAIPERFGEITSAVRVGIGQYFGWLYVLATTFFLLLSIFLMVSRYGNIRLGPDSSRPEFSTMAWFAMLFTAGMGIGLVFYGVYEPTLHLQDEFVNSVGPDPASQAMQYTLFHWGFHPWAVYIVLGLALGYFCFRKGLPMRPASALYPLIGDRIYGWIGNLIDILAVFGTLFGLATSLGLGTQQVSAGLSHVFGIPDNLVVQVVIICLITSIAVVSVVAGIDKGIRRLSVINLWMAFALLVVMFLVGPKLFQLSMMFTGLGEYLQNLVQMSLSYISPEGNEAASGFAQDWSIFYWGWWISWSPFVGMFLARISYGRTIRQFILGTLFAPVGVSVIWFGVFGGTGMFYDMFRLEGDDMISNSANEGAATFNLIDAFPLPAAILSLLALLTVAVVTIFFVTSSDSGSLVVDMLTNGGDPHPVRAQRIFWASMEGLITIVLLVVGGAEAISALQAAAVSTGLPFAIVLIVIAFSLLRALGKESPASTLPSGLVAPKNGKGPATVQIDGDRIPIDEPAHSTAPNDTAPKDTAPRDTGEK